jgi:hypothetical protein
MLVSTALISGSLKAACRSFTRSAGDARFARVVGYSTGRRPNSSRNDRARHSAGLVWRPDCDLDRGEVVRVDRTRHGEGSASAIGDEERASRGDLPMLCAEVPALVPLRISEISEVMHGQGDIPAAGGIQPGRRLPGGRSEAGYLGRRGGMKGDDDQGLGWAARSCANTRQDDDGGDDDCGCDGSDTNEPSSVTPPDRRASDHRPGRGLGRCRLVDGRWAGPDVIPGRRPELENRLDLGLGLRRKLAPGN